MDAVHKTNSKDPFQLALNAYEGAVWAKDIDAFLAIYDPGIHVFDMWGTWSLHGIAAWRNMASDWFASLGEERVVVTSDCSSSVVTGDLAIGHAILTYTAIAPDGATLRSLSSRATMALRKTGNRWKVFHEHTSAPIDHQTTKAVLQRGGG